MPDPNRLVIADDPALGSEVFVYGSQVPDFRSVDYEALTTLNVSATQELHRELDQLKTENTELKDRLRRLEERLGVK